MELTDMESTENNLSPDITDDLMYRAEIGERSALSELCNIILSAPAQLPERALWLLVAIWSSGQTGNKEAISADDCLEEYQSFSSKLRRAWTSPRVLPQLTQDATPSADNEEHDAAGFQRFQKMYRYRFMGKMLTEYSAIQRCLETLGTHLRHCELEERESFFCALAPSNLAELFADLWESGYGDMVQLDDCLPSRHRCQCLKEWHLSGSDRRVSYLLSEALRKQEKLALSLTYTAISAARYPELLFNMAESVANGFCDKSLYSSWEKELIDEFSQVTGIQVSHKGYTLQPDLKKAFQFCQWAKNHGVENVPIEELLNDRKTAQEETEKQWLQHAARMQKLDMGLWTAALLLLLLWPLFVSLAVKSPDSVWLYVAPLLALIGLCFPLPKASESLLSARIGLQKAESRLSHLISFYTIPVITLCTLFCAILMVFRGGLQEPLRQTIFCTQLSVLALVFIQHSIRLPLPPADEGLFGYLNAEHWCAYLLRGLRTTLTRFEAGTWLADILAKSVFIGLTALLFLPAEVSHVELSMGECTITTHALVYTAALVALMHGLCCLFRYLAMGARNTIIQFPAMRKCGIQRAELRVNIVICASVFVSLIVTAVIWQSLAAQQG